MRTSEETDKIIPAIHAVHKSVSWAGKSGTNTFAKYSYASLEDCKDAYEAALNEAGLFITTSVSGTNCASIDDGKHMMAVSRIEVRLWHTSGQWIEIDATGGGTDSGGNSEKSIPKSITNARKSGVTAILDIVPSETPSKEEKKKKRSDSNKSLTDKLGLDGGTDPRTLNAKTARQTIMAAGKAAGLTAKRVGDIVRGHMKDAGVEDFEHLPVAVRSVILRGIEKGDIK